MLQKIFLLPQKTFLKRRDTRLVTLWVSIFICLAGLCISILVAKAFHEGLRPGTVSYITAYSMLAISLIAAFTGFIIFAVSLIFKSVEEEKNEEETYRLDILESLGRIAEELFSKHLNESHLDPYVQMARYLKQESDHFPTSALSEDSVKILLKGVSNNLAVIYIILSDTEKLMNNTVIGKPKDWEQAMQRYQNETLFYIEAKEKLQKLYERIERCALNNGVKMIKNVNPKFRYLIYADSDILNQMEKMKK